jgi:hypothetical protein
MLWRLDPSRGSLSREDGVRMGNKESISCTRETRLRGGSMKRIRLSTLMLLIVIAALALALVVQNDRATRREAALRAQIPPLPSRSFQWPDIDIGKLPPPR